MRVSYIYAGTLDIERALRLESSPWKRFMHSWGLPSQTFYGAVVGFKTRLNDRGNFLKKCVSL